MREEMHTVLLDQANSRALRPRPRQAPTFLLAEFGFLGAVVYTRRQMPRLQGWPCSARYLGLRGLPAPPLRPPASSCRGEVGSVKG